MLGDSQIWHRRFAICDISVIKPQLTCDYVFKNNKLVSDVSYAQGELRYAFSADGVLVQHSSSNLLNETPRCEPFDVGKRLEQPW